MAKKTTLSFLIWCSVFLGVSAACSEPQQIPIYPRIEKEALQKTLPFSGVLYFSEKTRLFKYSSPEYIPWRGQRNTDKIRPFEIPVGQAFVSAAFQAFSEVWPTLAMSREVSAGNNYAVVIEPSLENIALDMIYVSYGTGAPQNQYLDVGGSLAGKLTLTREGKPAWQKAYRVYLPTEQLLVTPWTGKKIAGTLADAVATLVEAMVREMIGEPEKPAGPLDQWLKSLQE